MGGLLKLMISRIFYALLHCLRRSVINYFFYCLIMFYYFLLICTFNQTMYALIRYILVKTFPLM